MEQLLQMFMREFRAFKAEILDRISSLENNAAAAAPAVNADSGANAGDASQQKAAPAAAKAPGA
jgi:hypothetical protein